MAKYTENDLDIKYLDEYDRVNYNFELLKFDVDKSQEISEGASSVKIFTDSNKLGNMFKSPTKFTTGIFVLAVFIMFIMLIIFLLVMLIVNIINSSENELRFEVLKMILIYFITALVILIILYIFINKISSEVVATGFLAK